MTGVGGWASAGPHDAPSEPLVPFDATRPNVARAYDYLLGGKDNFAPDRELGEKILAIYPGARQTARENRRFPLRALSYVLPRGIAQYADLGAVLPTSPAVHEIVRHYSARAAICYVDNDPVVISHLGALVAKGDDRIRDVPGDLTDPPAVLSALQATGLIDWNRPVCLILAMVLHFLCATRRTAVSPAQRAGIGGDVSGSDGLPVTRKCHRENSMPANRRSRPGVWGDVPGDPRDMAKAGLPESQSPEGVCMPPAGKTPETGTGPYGRVEENLP